MDTYEKKYKEALELARVAAFNGHQSLMEGIFPELAESKDEKTRKRIIALVNAHGQGIYKGDMLAWLENIPYTIDHEKREGFHLGYKAALEKQGESSDKIHYWTEEEIEPIISDYLRGAEHYGGMIGRLRCLKPKSLEKQGDSPIKWNKNTEGNKPQVNHSVLMKTTQGIAEGEWKGEYWEQYRWAGIVRDSDVLSWMELSSLEKQGEQKPTLRERYKNIAESEWFKKTHEGMSVSDDEKVDNVNKIEQKPAWSEEDEEHYKACLQYFDEVNPDMVYYKDYQWLKSLKQRYTWKPSIAQLNALSIVSKGNTPDDIEAIVSLYNDLKKLTE